MNSSSNVVLIPARGGSKGIPRKNLMGIAGQPLVEHSIRASFASSVGRPWVSTEDDEIKAVALRLGASILDRPRELAGDTTSTEAVMLHFANHVPFGKMVLLQCTCPSTTPEDIDRALAMLDEYDSVVSVTRNHQFVWTERTPNYDPRQRPRRQEAPATYLETGGLYGVRRETLLADGCRIGGRIGFLEVPRIRSFDIDTYEDLELVRRLT